jgi:FAD/FMN-containing dehydrogenase
VASLLRRHKLGASLVALVVAIAAIYGARKAQVLAADPDGEKNCTPAPQGVDNALPDLAQVRAIKRLEGVTWKDDGETINDASCLNRVDLYGTVEVRSVDDIAKVLAFARANKLAVTAAGVKHSMGGHAFRKGGIVLDMTKFNRIVLNEADKTMTVQSGATWHDIQNVLHPKFAVRAMQSTDIFTVGGSISVNAHGMDHQAGAMARSIRSMRVMLADGTIEEVSSARNRELFDLVVGGYGLFGIILEAELAIVDNAVYQTARRTWDYREFAGRFAREIEGNRDIALMYGHLSTAPSSFLQEVLLYSYTRTDAAGATIPDTLGEVSGTKLRRLVFNLAKLGWPFAELKWLAEKHLERRIESCTITRTQALGSAEACLVSRNNPMHDSVLYLRNALPDDTDILHEYFVPRDRLASFIDGMRKVLRDNQANVLNASIRVVDKEANFLSYAPAAAFSVVLYLNQTTDEAGNRRMKKVTEDLIELTLAHGGRFFLPYQLYYSPEQLRRAYPEIRDFFAAKRKYDPAGLFTNTFHQKYAEAVSSLP